MNLPETSLLYRVLDRARWAPSGDNGQDWKIRIESPTSFSLDLSGFHRNAYNLIPMPDYISTGMFLENASLVAHEEGHSLRWKITDANRVVAELVPDATAEKSHLTTQIEKRSVNRLPFRTRQLLPETKRDAEALLDADMRLHWLEPLGERWKAANIMRRTTDIRLRMSETYPIHRDMVEWSAKDSPDRMPAASLGLNRMSQHMMRWALASARRNRMLLSMPGSTLSFQLELDIVPALMSAGHFIFSFDPQKTPAPTTSDYLRGGAAMQRFWLYLTSQGIALQPWYMPIMFSRYVTDGIDFTTNEPLQRKTEKLYQQFTKKILDPRDIPLSHVFFTGRIGYPKKIPAYRSTRKPLNDLIVA